LWLFWQFFNKILQFLISSNSLQKSTGNILYKYKQRRITIVFILKVHYWKSIFDGWNGVWYSTSNKSFYRTFVVVNFQYTNQKLVSGSTLPTFYAQLLHAQIPKAQKRLTGRLFCAFRICSLKSFEYKYWWNRPLVDFLSPLVLLRVVNNSLLYDSISNKLHDKYPTVTNMTKRKCTENTFHQPI